MASTQEIMNASRNQANDENQKRFKEMGKLVGKQEARLQNLQNVAFQLANYYFVFQGVILAAIANASGLTCSDRWFVFALSLLAAIVNLSALFTIGSKYINILSQYDKTWSEYNDLMRRLSPNTQKSSATTRISSPQTRSALGRDGNAKIFSPKLGRSERATYVEDHQRTSETEDQPWGDPDAKAKRYFFLIMCIVLFLGFAVVIFVGCWKVLCRHGDCKHGPYPNHNVDCYKFCNGSKCMVLCNDFM